LELGVTGYLLFLDAILAGVVFHQGPVPFAWVGLQGAMVVGSLGSLLFVIHHGDGRPQRVGGIGTMLRKVVDSVWTLDRME